jgi:hypothetical protein
MDSTLSLVATCHLQMLFQIFDEITIFCEANLRILKMHFIVENACLNCKRQELLSKLVLSEFRITLGKNLRPCFGLETTPNLFVVVTNFRDPIL